MYEIEILKYIYIKVQIKLISNQKKLIFTLNYIKYDVSLKLQFC